MNALHDNPLRIHTAVYLTCMLPYLDESEVEKLCGKLKGLMAVKHGRAYRRFPQRRKKNLIRCIFRCRSG